MAIINTLSAVLVKTLKAYPFTECNTPNSFGVIGNDDAFALSNWGLNMRDYKKGFFWARAFEGNGANENDLKMQHPSVFLRQHRTRSRMNDKGTECLTFELGVVDAYDCETCGENCNRTVTELGNDLWSILNNVLKEIGRNEPYQIGSTSIAYMTTEESDQFRLDSPLLTVEKMYNGMLDKLKNITPMHDGAVGEGKELKVSLTFTICGCFTKEVIFDYSQKQPFDKMAFVHCETCV
jgi:hypothetical protein